MMHHSPPCFLSATHTHTRKPIMQRRCSEAGGHVPCSSKLGHALTRSCSGCWVKDHPCDDLAPPSEHHVTSAGEKIRLEDQDSVELREKQRHKLGGPDVRVQRRLVTVVCNNIDGAAAT